MLAKFVAIAIILLLSFIPATAAGKDKETVDNSQHSELLEFLGEWETDGGSWVDPTDIDWLMMPEQESGEDEKQIP